MARPFRGPEAADAPKVSPKRARALLRRLLSLAKPEWKPLSVALVMLLIGSAGGVAFPQAIKQILDSALRPGGDPSVIDRTALVLLGIFVVQGAANALRFALFSASGERVVTRLRIDLFDKLLGQDIGFFDGKRTGDLTSSLVSDTAVLQSAVSLNISMLFRNGAQVLAGVVMLFYTSLPLTLIMLGIVPPIAIGAVVYGKRVRKLARAAQDAIGESGSIAEESLSNIRTVRAFTAERNERTRFDAAASKSFVLARKRIVTSSAFMGVAMTAAFGAVALVFWYGGRQVLAGTMTPGALTSFLIYTLTVAFGLAALADLWSDFMRAAGVAERVFELLDRRPTIPLEGGRTLDRVEGRVEFERVSFHYPTRPDVPVLVDLDLAVRPREVVAIVGHSGAGKSTLAALLARLYDPTAGAVRIDGAPLVELDPTWLRGQIGVVSQEPVLFSASVADNIRYGKRDATDAEVEAAARAANAHDFIRAFPEGYATEVGERGVQLSGGQKQRVAIARAILKDPRILILDEATSALDAESEHLVREALERLQRASSTDGGAGRTTLVIAHRLSTIANADRVVVMEGGKIVEQGTHQRLMKEAGIYKRLVEKQLHSGLLEGGGVLEGDLVDASRVSSHERADGAPLSGGSSAESTAAS
ncbi:MAG: ABC transporter transmembrane domain-containing protein [Polyangiaceae bacterium]